MGIAIWFLTYSTWTGRHGIWLEDLYVDEADFAVDPGAAAKNIKADAAQVLDESIAALEAVPEWTAEAIEAALKGRLIEELELKPRKAYAPIRIGVTGLSRAGKTVFITSLVANLLERGRMPQFRAAAEGRILAAFLQPQPDDTLPINLIADLQAALDGKVDAAPGMGFC